MSSIDFLDAKVTALANALARAELVRERVAALGDDVYEDDTVLHFQRTFSFGARTYTFAALKAEGFWYVTGPTQSGRARTWHELVAFVTDNGEQDNLVWRATEFEQVSA